MGRVYTQVVYHYFRTSAWHIGRYPCKDVMLLCKKATRYCFTISSSFDLIGPPTPHSYLLIKDTGMKSSTGFPCSSTKSSCVSNPSIGSASCDFPSLSDHVTMSRKGLVSLNFSDFMIGWRFHK